MKQEKLKNLRKLKGISQEKMAKILSTDPSNYSRKERGEVRIHEDEWKKIAESLSVSISDIKEEEEMVFSNKNSTFKDSAQYQYIQNFNYSIIENLQDYIDFLKQKICELNEENQILKSQNDFSS
ncbi:helix-turn-helix domain-containing protein [Chryseobacterium sp. D764]|jgi:transcriptional regulator with XRE-family HTH domain|uniref:helix-turn-helix domain-containing protein n=1 Tax=unclassified Chryseobacterium TaxID=2593645 RepID=UPI000984B706|nr:MULTISPECIES: helix-turn-helix transcriptional regulator [unclassified Chryseobacterium]QXU48856.1 helix-turn-helix domain-containing protein [Chryseobacterium sp. D764]CAD0223893.1 Transcriptional regulator [Chryseobacterium sp. JV274]